MQVLTCRNVLSFWIALFSRHCFGSLSCREENTVSFDGSTKSTYSSSLWPNSPDHSPVRVTDKIWNKNNKGDSKLAEFKIKGGNEHEFYLLFCTEQIPDSSSYFGTRDRLYEDIVGTCVQVAINVNQSDYYDISYSGDQFAGYWTYHPWPFLHSSLNNSEVYKGKDDWDVATANFEEKLIRPDESMSRDSISI